MGPFNGSFGVLSSPAYYYVVAAILYIKDDILFLELVNIILQVITIASVYFIAKLLFSPTTALIAVILFSFSRVVLQWSLFFFQPFFTQPFIYIGYLLIVLSYIKRKFIVLPVGVLFVVLAAIIHNSAASVLPLVALISFVIIKRLNWRKSYFFIILLAVIILLEISYLPAIVNLRSNGYNTAGQLSQSFAQSPLEITDNLVKATHVLFNLNLYTYGNGNNDSFFSKDPLSNLLIILMVGLILYYLLKVSSKPSKTYVSWGLGLITATIIVASLLNRELWGRHLFLILGPLTILCAEVIRAVFPKNPIATLFKVVLIVLLIKSMSSNFQGFQFEAGGQKLGNLFYEFVAKPTFAIEEEVLNIQKQNNETNLHFFDIYVYPEAAAINGYSNAAFWLQLEKRFNTTFTKIDRNALGFGYSTSNDGRYIFLICNAYILEDKIGRCLEDSLKEFPDYSLVREIYTDHPYNIYLISNQNK